ELRARANDKRPGINLRDVLQLGAVDFQFTAIVLVHTRQERAGDGAVSRCLRKHQDRLVRIRNLDAVLQATRQEERVLARAPLVVIAGQQQWLLVFLEPISGTEKGRIVRVINPRQITALRIVINSLKINRVVEAQLLFQLQGKSQLFQ